MSECFIHESLLEDGSSGVSYVEGKGIASLLTASEKRKDGNWATLRKKTSRQEDFVETHKLRETRSAVPDFAFRTNCFICVLPITEQFLAAKAKKPPDLRNVVNQVRDITGGLRERGKTLNAAIYQQKCKSEKEERLQIVEAAARIICDDIRSQVYIVKEYPAPDRLMDGTESLISEMLKHSITTLIIDRKKGRYKDKWKDKSHAISHLIISAVRPRSFLSNLQVGLAAYIYEKFGSRKLLDVLSSLWFRSTYVKAVWFEISPTLKTESELCAEGFIQFIYDNADFNTQTIDGYSTFHVMGGMYTVGPASAVPPDATIARSTKIPAAEVVGRFGHLTLKHFEAKQGGDGFKEIKTQDMSSKFQTSPSTYSSAVEVLWLLSKNKEFDIIPGWSAFMEEATKDRSFEETYTACLPFTNSPFSDYNILHTAMVESIQKCRAENQTWCFITFDQPLYLKAGFIAANSNDSRLKYVILRLGGFHLLMSYLGSVCYPIDGSG
ncbi:hypothetical protein JTB14_024068 [Gonioctena quinquepunctata]|nr:hypothetical protein JTB14_024068 [Gonioctena quinquepunctata]